MPFTIYPFEAKAPDKDVLKNPLKSKFFKSLPSSLQDRAGRDLHLLRYLQQLPVDEIGAPGFTEDLSKNDGEVEHLNIIYPTLNGLYTHVLSDPEKVRDFYIGIEPQFEHPNVESLIEDVEGYLLDFSEMFAAVRTDEDLRDALDAALDRIYGKSISNSLQKGGRGNFLGPLAKLSMKGLRKNGGGSDFLSKWNLEDGEAVGLKYRILKDKAGVGVLQPLIYDPHIEDISCSGVGILFVEHKIFNSLRTSFGFSSFDELDEYVLRLSERIKKPVTYRQPVVDATMPDGSRINIVYGKDVSARGSNFSIRKTFDEPISITQLCLWGSLNWEMAAYLSLVIEDGMNIFVSGETASGKTTLLNALTTFIHPTAKIVSIEDTAEVQLPHQNWIREISRKPKDGETGGGVGMFELLKAALRQRPNEIIIGEIRGEEGAVAFQAMQTGHACMATFHASSIQKLVQRLTGHPINIPKMYVDNLNCVAIQTAVRLPTGKEGRRAVSVNEIVGYDSESESFSFVEAFQWDPSVDKFTFSGNMNSFLLEKKIAVMRGYPFAKRRQIYSLLQRRARVLNKLADSGVTGFEDLYKLLAKANREGIF
ncbi:MAG: type II/IV secretion system ATPase subunit [Chloroflexi bacterium]|nr:type II/IV secretion system ATPase subunit [Chloroflexota bacterium]